MLLLAGSAHAQTVISSCATTLTGNGVLSGDLDCTSYGAAVVMDQDSALDLNGFTLTGLVDCRKNCWVKGPGVVVGSVEEDFTASGVGINVTGGAEVQGAVQTSGDVGMNGSTVVGTVRGDTVTILHSTVRDSFSLVGIGGNLVQLLDANVFNHETGVSCLRCSIFQSTISGNGDGVSCDDQPLVPGKRSVFLFTSHIDGNFNAGVNCPGDVHMVGGTLYGNTGQGIYAKGQDAGGHWHGRVRLENGHVQDNGYAINAVRARISDSDVATSTFYGVVARKMSLKTSSVHDNGTDPTCATFGSCADLLGTSRPRVSPDSTCGTSLDDTGATWGICSQD